MKKNNYELMSLVEIAKKLVNNNTRKIEIDGENLNLEAMSKIYENEGEIELTSNRKVLDRIEYCYKHMIKQIENGVPVYGVNTGYGGQASLVVNEGTEEQRLNMARKISESIIHVDVSTGPAIPKEITRTAMAIRANMLMKGVSAVRPSDISFYCELLNNNLIPKVGFFGGLGASGDLPQNGRVLSVMRQIKGTKLWGEKGEFVDAVKTLKDKGIKKLELEPKAGLGLVNGDNFSTAIAFYVARETLFALLTQSVVGAMVFEVLLATNRSLHPLISEVRQHEGQGEMAKIYRKLIEGSKYIRDEMKELLPRVEGRKVQDVYSIRCLTQYLGPSWEKIKWAFNKIEINANSASDNPLWTTKSSLVAGEEEGQWVSGGNFLAMYMSEVIDNLRKTITHIVKLNDRHMSKLIDPNENNGLGANLSSSKAISQCVFKGIQAQAGMFEVFSTYLSFPISTLFGVHEQNNQDITSHAMTSGYLAKENIQICWLSLAQTMIALAQAVDLREGAENLSPKTKMLYDFVRKYVAFSEEERPFGPAIEELAEKIQGKDFRKLLINKILK